MPSIAAGMMEGIAVGGVGVIVVFVDLLAVALIIDVVM
jgi:hypothetical protein